MRFATRLPGLILPLLLATFLAAGALPAHAQTVADIETAWRGWMTMNGRGSSCVVSSIETEFSDIASSSADWVRGVVRLISSASTTFAKIGPRLSSKTFPDWS